MCAATLAPATELFIGSILLSNHSHRSIAETSSVFSSAFGLRFNSWYSFKIVSFNSRSVFCLSAFRNSIRCHCYCAPSFRTTFERFRIVPRSESNGIAGGAIGFDHLSAIDWSIRDLSVAISRFLFGCQACYHVAVGAFNNFTFSRHLTATRRKRSCHRGPTDTGTHSSIAAVVTFACFSLDVTRHRSFHDCHLDQLTNCRHACLDLGYRFLFSVFRKLVMAFVGCSLSTSTRHNNSVLRILFPRTSLRTISRVSFLAFSLEFV